MNENIDNQSFKNKGLSGLVNMGNTCFINACVQIISHTYELNSVFDSLTENKLNIKDKDSCILLMEWNNLRKLLWRENTIIFPSKFIHTIKVVAGKKRIPHFTDFSQNDAQEFMLFLVDCFHNSVSRSINMNIIGSPENNTDKLATKCFEMVKQRHEKEYSEFWNLLYGIQVSEIFDANTNVLLYQKPESYFMIDLPIPQSSPNSSSIISILDCFNLYVEGEFIEGWKNKERKQTVNIHKKLSFWSFPNILIISLKRFKDTNIKNKSLIHFPLELDLTKYVIGYKKTSFLYNLYGVCNHFGASPSGGHYTSYIKNINKWYEFDDMNVIEKSVHGIVTPNAYMLFYRRL
jgi:ubiquitin C-terminal hydrolase